MTTTRTTAERLDAAIDLLAAGHAPASVMAHASVDPADAVLVDTAARLTTALRLPPVAARFEARLGARLAGAVQPREALARALRRPSRMFLTGAVGSALGVGVTVTAFAVWRSARRATGLRLLPR